MTSKVINELTDFLKVHGHWYTYSSGKLGQIKWTFQFLRIVFQIASLAVLSFEIYSVGFELSLNGLLSFFPLSAILAGQAVMYYINHGKMKILMESLRTQILSNLNDWQEEMFLKVYIEAWKIFKWYKTIIFTSSTIYYVIPFFIDTILFNFNLIDKPFVFPLPYGAFLDGRRSLTYYSVTISSIMFSFIVLYCHLGVAGSYCFFIACAYADIKIFKKMITELQTPPSFQKNKIKDVIKKHSNLLRYTKDLSLFFGPVCTFQKVMISMLLCLCLFVTCKTQNAIICLVYTYSLIIFSSICYIFCFLGQSLETESEEVFDYLCSLPWHTCSPRIRNDINMMIRQAVKPIRIDYKGISPMNLHTYMQILHMSYSYFALLKSVLNK